MIAFGQKFTKCFLIPQRYILGIMTSLATFTSYTMRAALNIGITEMVIKTNQTLLNNTDTCPIVDFETYSTVKNTDVLYDWDEIEQGLILSSFYWSYIITHLPGSLLSERFGGKHVLGTGMLINTILTLLFPIIIISANGNWYIVTAVRFMMGLGQGMVYPVVTGMLGQWVPAKEKGTMASLAYAGAIMGTVVCNSLSGVLINAVKHWNIIFYFFGFLGLCWNITWQLICYSYPRTHPCLKEKEKVFLDEQLGTHVSKTVLKTPWKEMLTSLPVWALIIAQFGHDWGWFIMVTDLPKYMSGILRFNILQNGIWSALPYVFMWFATMIFGYLADWFVEKKYMSVAMARKIFGTIGNMGPAIFMVLASYVGCDRTLAVTMFTVAMFCMGFFFCGIKVNALDLSPNFAGTVMALANGIGVFAGIAAPALVGVMTTNQTLSEWRYVFWLAFVILLVSNLIFVLFMSADVQPWNQPKSDND